MKSFLAVKQIPRKPGWLSQRKTQKTQLLNWQYQLLLLNNLKHQKTLLSTFNHISLSRQSMRPFLIHPPLGLPAQLTRRRLLTMSF